MFTPNREKVYDNSFTTKPAQNTYASRKLGNSSSKRNSPKFVNGKNILGSSWLTLRAAAKPASTIGKLVLDMT